MTQHSDAFLKAFSALMKHEGGWVNDPNDPGGATKWGVSLRFLRNIYPQSSTYKRLFGNQQPSAELVNNLTQAHAKAFFNDYFWEPVKGDHYNERMATAVSDFAYNAGVKRAIKVAQLALNAIAKRVAFVEGVATSPILKVDGVLGPKTLERLRVQSGKADAFLFTFADMRIKFYEDLANRRPSMVKFLKGWKRRTYAKSNMPLGYEPGDELDG